MIELERTYLLKEIPKNLKQFKFKEIIDIYIPKSDAHPVLRIRKNGNKFEMTKKQPVKGTDSSCQEEQTIILNQEEFNELNKIDGKKVRKLRYIYEYKGRIAEVDVFQDLLKGLILVDFEFENLDEMNSFKMPEFCLAEVTQEKFTAGGMLCGKSYKDIENELMKFNYKKLVLV